MKTSICALRSGGQLFCVAVVEGRIKPQGELITHDGKTYDIENLKNLGTDWIGKQIQVCRLCFEAGGRSFGGWSGP